MVQHDANTINKYYRMKIKSIFLLLLSEDTAKVRMLMFCNNQMLRLFCKINFKTFFTYLIISNLKIDVEKI